MRRSTWLVTIGAALAFCAAQAPLVQAEENSQQTKMGTCNTDATSQGLSGADRKAFMKKCLSKAKTNSQNEKMKSCNADATTKGLKGADRKAYMKTCLSGSGTAH